ncbi:MAG: methyltransferase domain-containing protein [Planctomycetes bacterium]|nr:methyltransferase domain-containing protein [Planctomycetota bacterium]
MHPHKLSTLRTDAPPQGAEESAPTLVRRDLAPLSLRPAAPPVTSDACLACKSVYNYPLARWEDMPLSVLGLPRSTEEARNMRGFVLDVRQCASCGHVFHTDFHYDHIPYRNGSNLVYNDGAAWKAYQDELAEEWISSYGLSGKRIVEIGCGEGRFLQRMQRAGNHCIGFEPGSDAARAAAAGIECYPEYFQGSRLFDLRADAIICRHVLEHLADPLDFLEDISIACSAAGIAPLFLAEVPCIEKALEQNRINDFLYEHVSNFTCSSFCTLFERAGFRVLDLRTRFQEEVVTIAARPRLSHTQREVHARAQRFRLEVEEKIARTRRTLEAWRTAGMRVALWGATGKGAALMNMVGITPDLCDLVIDSDVRKVGGFVPGTGQLIQGPQALLDEPADRILICTNWRARDIEREIRQVHGMDAELFVVHDHGVVHLVDDLVL